MKAEDYGNIKPILSTRLFGTTDETGQTKNFTVQSVLELNSIPAVVTGNSLSSAVISNINTYFTGSASGIFNITFPSANPNLDGLKYVVVSTIQRSNVAWFSSGATFVGAPNILLGQPSITPVCFQYNHSDTTWYRSL